MNNNEYRINALPAKTWYQLNMNDTRLLWDDNLVPCDMDTKGCDNVCSDVNAKDYSDIENAVLTGAGKEADVLFEAGVTNTLLVNADKETNGQTLYINVNGNDKSQSGKIIVNVEDNVTFTIIENFKGESSTEGRVALRTLIDTGLNSKVRLIQVYMQPESIDVLSDTGCRLSDNASFEIVQVFVGRGSLYDGIRTELIGNNSAFTADIGYLGAKKQNIDINLISNHIGKKTNSGIRVDGALKDEASKLFRGSIDFKMVLLVQLVQRQKMYFYLAKMSEIRQYLLYSVQRKMLMVHTELQSVSSMRKHCSIMLQEALIRRTLRI